MCGGVHQLLQDLVGTDVAELLVVVVCEGRPIDVVRRRAGGVQRGGACGCVLAPASFVCVRERHSLKEEEPAASVTDAK